MKVSEIQIQNSQPRSSGMQAPTVNGADPRADKKLWKACQDFEALFMGYLVKSMERTLPEGSLSGSGISEMMFNQVMGSALSEGGGIGLAELLYRDLQTKHAQESTENENGTSLQDLLLNPVRKEINDDQSSR